MSRLHRIVTAVSGVALLGACGSEQVVQFTATEPPEPASVRLFFGTAEVTQHVPLNASQTHRLEVRLYAANGVRITGYDDHFALTVELSPGSLATPAAVAGSPLLADLTASATPGEAGSLRVALLHAHAMTVRTFGPFDVLVH
jgi:hypothetical protein